MEFIPVLLGVGLLAALGYSIYYSYNLEQQIWERDRTIQELSFRSKLVEKYFDIEFDSNDSLTYYTLKDSIRSSFLSTKKLAQEKKNYDELLIALEDVMKQQDELVDDYNGLVRKYNSLYKEVGSISKEKDQLKEDKKRLEIVLRMIERKYKISYNITIDSSHVTTILKNTDMVDSGMMLLPYYRDKIKREPNGAWIITFSNKQEVIKK